VRPNGLNNIEVRGVDRMRVQSPRAKIFQIFYIVRDFVLRIIVLHKVPFRFVLARAIE